MKSNPRVFTELIKGFGCQGAQVEEIRSLEPENFEELKPLDGLGFLFKRQQEEPAGSVVQDRRLDTFFFVVVKQVINNVCATQAIVSVLLNCIIKMSIQERCYQSLKNFHKVLMQQ